MKPALTYVLPDKVGGVVTIVANLLAYRQPDEFEHQAILTHNAFDTDARFGGALAADAQRTFEFRFPVENVRAVTTRFRRALTPGPGVLVSNDFLELAMLSDYDPGLTVFQILHGDIPYYYQLAEHHEPLIHAFIAYSRAMYDRLCSRLPHRAESIFHLPYGVPRPRRFRTSGGTGPLRLLYAGRLSHGQKGIFDLPLIAAALGDIGVRVRWTIIGGGPDEQELRNRWSGDPDVTWLGVKTASEVVDLAADHDVFVLPTRFEGFPVALLEAMSAGAVPVVSAIGSGVSEIVSPEVGYTPPVGDIAAFAQAIAAAAADRPRLDAMSAAARDLVAARFDIGERTRAYQALFARWRDLYRPRPPGRIVHHGSRLDQPWIPNNVVSTIRRGIRWFTERRRRAAS